MHIRKRVVVAVSLVIAVALVGCTGDQRAEEQRGNERWATTENTSVKIDWDKVGEAYKQAEGPTDFERRVNEIYEGDEVVSISVHDLDDKTQVVTGFFDKNANGKVEDAEKIFTISRSVTGEGTGQYQMSGHGPHYGYYRSPMLDIATGMLLGSMISGAFRPNYVPMQAYTTSSSRAGELRSQRQSYRAANPGRFSKQSKASGTGRTYNSKGTRSWGSGGGRSGGGGGRFGTRRRQREGKPERLTA